MIPSRNIRNARVATPILNMLVDAPFIEKAVLKAIYPQWRGESISEIREKHSDNPYRVRIGTPNTDTALQSDHAFFIRLESIGLLCIHLLHSYSILIQTSDIV